METGYCSSRIGDGLSAGAVAIKALPPPNSELLIF
jgi:hypothetical protein